MNLNIPELVASYGTPEDVRRTPEVLEHCSEQAVAVFARGVLDRALDRCVVSDDPYEREWAERVLNARLALD